jgi:hypothetical protein
MPVLYNKTEILVNEHRKRPAYVETSRNSSDPFVQGELTEMSSEYKNICLIHMGQHRPTSICKSK